MNFHFTLQQLRLFEAVARLRSFSRASQELHITQPAVSIQIKRMEEALGVPLLERIGRKLYLTGPGEETYAACREVIQRLENLSTTLEDLQGGVKGTLKLSAVTTAKYVLPHLMGVFAHRYPEADVSLKVTNRSRVLTHLAENESDMVVMGQVPPELEVDVHPFMENRLVFTAPADHRLAGKRDIPLAELAGERFLLREPDSGTRRAMDRLFAEQGLDYGGRMELGSTEAIKQAVMAGLGVSVLPLHSLALELATRRVVLLDVQRFPLVRHWYIVYPKSKKLSLLARTFLDFLTDEAEEILTRVMETK